MLKKKKKKILYEKWKEEHQIKQDKEEISEVIGAESQIVVRKVTFWVRLMQIVGDIIGFLFKFMVVIILLALLTLSIIVLINEPLRTPVFEFIKQYTYR